MGLSNDLLSQFAKVTNDTSKKKKETSTVYGTVVEGGGVKLDGSDIVTPVSTTVDMKAGDRVIVMIKNHSATVTGNLNDPAASSQGVSESSKKITDLEIAVADRVTTKQLNAEKANITKELTAADAVIKNELTASIVEVEKKLTAADVEITGKVTAAEGEITELKTNKLDAESAALTYATIKNLEVTDEKVNNLNATHAKFEEATVKNFEAVDADIEELDTKKLDTESAKVIYANIDFSNIGKAAIEEFFSKSGMISDLVVGDGTVTGKLVGVTISGDLIEGNTVKAEKLVVKGSDGLYYKLNIEAGATTSEKVTASDLQNGLHGTAIIAKTITAEKISVNDLVAFGATIGGFHITNSSLYSGTKSAVNDTTQGVYVDSTGQMAVGDADNFINYYKDASGKYRLEISASSVLLGSSKKSVEAAINEVKSSVDNIEIGGTNLVATSYLTESSWGINFNGESTKEFTVKSWVGEAISNARVKEKFKSGETYTMSCEIEIIELPEYTANGVYDSNVAFYIYSVATNYDLMINATLKEGNRGELGAKYFINKTFVFPEIQDDTKIVMYTCLYKNASGAPGDATTVKVTNFKIEKGNKATDWTPAPEDVATAKEVDTAQTTANDAEEKAYNAQTLIAQLAENISMLVTDGNGTSLMTQTEEGWTFSTANIQGLVNNISDGLSSLTEEVGDVEGTVTVLEQAVADLGEIAEYVKIGTYEGEPCIELGEGDSDFKLRITNTRMVFTEGSDVLAYFNNQSLHIKKAVVEEEFQQGGFVWKIRSNGNLALVWKGDTE